MVVIKRIQTLIIESNFFAALGVWSLVKLTGLLYSVDVENFAMFSFFSTLLVYSFSILFSVGRFKGFKFIFSIDNLLVQKLVLVVSASIIPFFLFQFSIETLLMLIPVGLVSFLYPVEVVSDNTQGITLREFPYLKIFLIGISWAIVTVTIPILENGIVFDLSILIETVVRAMFVVAITIPFDIRDVYSDSTYMKTLPQKLGVSRAKYLAYLLLVINYIYYITFTNLNTVSLFLILLVLVITSILVKFASSDKPKFYYAVLIESTSVLLFISALS